MLRQRETGKETAINAGLEIGRHEACGLPIADGSVSRHHARVEDRAGALWLVDLGSSNGTKHNGRSEGEFPLRPGDLVTFGAIAFDVVGELAPRPAAAADAPRAAEPDLAEVERRRIHAELRRERRARGFGDLGQLPFLAQLVAGLLALAFLAAVVVGVLWLGGAI